MSQLWFEELYDLMKRHNLKSIKALSDSAYIDVDAEIFIYGFDIKFNKNKNESEEK